MLRQQLNFPHDGSSSSMPHSGGMLPTAPLQLPLRSGKQTKYRTRKMQRKAAGVLFLVAFATLIVKFIKWNAYYSLTPLPLFGCEVRNFNLTRLDVPERAKAFLRKDLYQCGFLLFRNSGLDPELQMEVSSWFGQPEDRKPLFSVPGKSVHPNIIQLCNDGTCNFISEGAPQAWHKDQILKLMPPPVALYHMAAASRRAMTLFVQLDKVLECVPRERAAYWSRLSIDFKGALRPMVWEHPIKKTPTMLFHTGLSFELVLDAKLPTEHHLIAYGNDSETMIVHQSIADSIDNECNHLVYTHLWRTDDLVITDNWGLAHAGGPGSELPPKQVGLRDLRASHLQGTVLAKPYRII